jgi:hypothetical protein
MKKYLLSLIIIVALGAASASAQFRYGPMVGVDITNLKFRQNLFTVDQSVGFSAGVATELMFPGIGFGINSGIYYEQRGATLHLGEREIWSSLGYGTDRSYLHYIEIPIHLRFKYTRLNGLEDYIAPFVYGGPSFSILAGHSDVKALSYAGGEMGLTAGLGFEIYKNWQVSASYTWGMVYATKTKLLDDFSAKNRTWDVRFTYFF